MNRVCWSFFLLMTFLIPLGAQAPQTIFTNGRFYTVNPKQPWAEAVAVRDGRITAVGKAAEVMAAKGEKTRVVDLGGQFVMPGFVEGHAHLRGLGESQLNLKLNEARNWDEIVAMVAKAAAEAPAGQWIIGRGWHQEKWDKQPAQTERGFPTHDLLSKAAPNHPVWLDHASGHAGIANAKAMELAGVTDKTADPEGGEILHDGAGKVTGVFNETAAGLIVAAYQKHLDALTPEARAKRLRRALRLAMMECLSKGITSFQDAGVDWETLDQLRSFADESKLGLRLWLMALGSPADLRKRLPAYKDLRQAGGGFLTLGGIKAYSDGALGSRGAWLLKPYSDDPTTSGHNVTDLDVLAEIADVALEHKLQLCVHAIGDRGNREVLDLFARKLKGRDLRWRIEHAQHLNPQDIPRFAELKIIASMQGVHCTSDAPFVVKRLGEQRAREGAYVWRSLWQSGAVVSNGTDAPVEDVSPLASLQSTVTRLTRAGETFFPEQVLRREQAIQSYTLNAAFAAFEDQDKGSLEVGKFADMVVLDQDLTKVPGEKIGATRVLKTIVAGMTRYRAP
ncbi:amidohydrolase [Acanthopleuribacter pedis]|uniref:Amidohydrolase n=1 Tax=Acanthopleuribacter pedis TaxID=442870 RepID=A0A8J7QFS5_9BACT|nr:amidohydrolase [Acanthopleuribacter pedis]MBO1323299.1 amidohydrolase [Acanthopleuribacter pedis]